MCEYFMADKTRKTSKQLERHLKGLANHRRLDILMLVARRQGITTEEISLALDCNFKTISMHTLNLGQAGLVDKKYAGRNVKHSLSPYCKVFFRLLETF